MENKLPLQGPQFRTAQMSNLITDMTIAGASDDELSRVIKHSVVAMDYEKSAVDNDIASLMEKYQGRRNAAVVHRLMMTNRHTFKEVSEILGVPLEQVRVIFEESTS